MKKVIYLVMVIVLAAILGGPQNVRSQEPIELKWASPFPLKHPSSVMEMRFIESIHKYTKNKVKISYFPAEQLGKAKDLLSLCSQGATDIAHIHLTYFAGQLPLNNVVQLPFYVKASEGAKIYQALITRSPEIQQEFAKYGVKPLLGYTTTTYEVATIKKPVRSVEDCKGLKLKTAGGTYDKIARRFGINPVSIAAAETYEAMQRGIVEGCIFNYPSIRSYRLNDHIKYITNGMKCGVYPLMMIINQKKWEKLPADVQEGILKMAEENGQWGGAYWDELLVEVSKGFEKQGIQIYNIPAQDRAKWDAPLKGIEEEYIKETEKKNLPGKKVFNDFLKIVHEVVK